MASDKEKYRALCKKEESILVFQQDWWLDAVCGDSIWDVVILEKMEGGEKKIIAALPYVLNITKVVFRRIATPQLTQFIGPWIKYPDNLKYEKMLAYEKEVIGELLKGLPQVDFIQMKMSYKYKNWLPFYWKGFSAVPGYTYVIENINNVEDLESTFSHAKRKNVKRALKSNLTVRFDLSAKDFYDNHKFTLKKQGAEIAYSYELFEKIVKSAYLNNAGKTIFASDKEGNIHAALFVIWDNESAYDLVSTIDPDFRWSGAATLLIREIIRYVNKQGVKKFDFEGSMIEGVENSFRQFGTVQKIYFQIEKKVTKKYKALWSLREFINAIKE